MKSNEGGQSLLEVTLLGLLLLVPLVWVLGLLADMHKGVLASTAAAREAGFEIARTPREGSANGAVEIAIAEAFADHGVDPSDARVTWTAGSFDRGAPIEISISYPVPLLQIPFVGEIRGPSLWIEARHVTHVPRYLSRDE